MARSARLKSSTGVYHIMMRGINHQNIFRDNADRDKFLWYLQSAQKYENNISGRKAVNFSIFAYALLGNHFHLLVKVNSGELGDLVKKIASGYVRYFNLRHKCDGHLFRERFKSEPCETFNYFCMLMGYIHQNPIKHGFTQNLNDYKYTSWHEYSDSDSDRPKLCDVDYVISKMSLEDIRKWVVEMLPANLKCMDIDKKAGCITDQSLTDYLKDKYGIESTHKFKEMEKGHKKSVIADLLDYGGSIRQISRITGVNAMAVSRINASREIENVTK